MTPETGPGPDETAEAIPMDTADLDAVHVEIDIDAATDIDVDAHTDADADTDTDIDEATATDTATDTDADIDAAAPANAYWSEEAGAMVDLPERDDVTWQLSTDMAPLPPLRQCVEAILLVIDEPVAEVMLAQITERPRDEVTAVLNELAAEYTEQQRGFDLRHVAGGWRLYTRASCAPLVEKFVLDGQHARLSQPALETLAVVAYRQPVSRSRISAVRGVNCDGVIRTLLTRGLVEEAGSDFESGAILYRTTPYFLERMGMRSLDELPELAPLLPSAASMEESESLT